MVGTLIGGRYRVLRRIGGGGMGTIYEVQHIALRRSFAMKKLAPTLASVQDELDRFRREADIVARLRHPHIVDVTDWETAADGSPCIIMEYLEGRDLGARISRSGPLPWLVLGRVADHALSALAAAHAAGVVHRDIKPQNIFIVEAGAEWQAKLLDFGVSEFHGHERAAGEGELLLGTPAYMAPEQAFGQHDRIGPASDVWAMSVVLYEMATGRTPFAAETQAKTLHAICYGSPAPVSSARADAPHAFEELLARALSRESDRITSVDELRAGLRAALRSISPGAFAEPLPVGEMTDARIELPLASPAATTRGGDVVWDGLGATTVVTPSEVVPRPRAPRPRAGLIAAVAIAFVVAGAAIMLMATSDGSSPPDAEVTGAVAPNTTAPKRRDPRPRPAADDEPFAAAETVLGAAAEAPADAGTDSDLVVIEVADPPRGLVVELDGARVEGPVVEIPRDGARHEVELRAPAHRSETIVVDASTRSHTVTLERRRRRPSRPPRGDVPPPLTP